MQGSGGRVGWLRRAREENGNIKSTGAGIGVQTEKIRIMIIDKQKFKGFLNKIQVNLIIIKNRQDMLYSGKKGLSPFESSSKKKAKYIDRFIPHSVSKNLYPLFQQHSENTKQDKNYSNVLQENLLTSNSTSKVLRFTDQSVQQEKQNKSSNIEDHELKEKKKNKRKIEPLKKWEVPFLRDDFYLNLVDCSDNDQIGIGLNGSLIIRSGCFSKVTKVYDSGDPYDYVCSVSFVKDTPKICSGFPDGKIKIFDITKCSLHQEYQAAHFGRIGSLSCTNNLVCSGGRDGIVTVQDLRQQKEIKKYKAHSQQICGLKICPSGELVATGGNDNKLFLFSMRKMGKLASWNEHKAAVKAIGFNPKEPTISSGGGTADRKIRVFSLQTLELLNQVDTESQICNLLYSPVSNELVTTHGYSLNQINLWKWGSNGSLEKIESLMGHKSRVLYLAGQSAGGKIITGAGGDEIRLWKMFEENQFSIPYDLR